MERVNIYIKGVCDYRNGRKGAYASAVTRVTENNEIACYFSTKSYATVQNNFVAEIEGITDALKHVSADTSIDVFTNNQVLTAILDYEHYGYQYDDAIREYWDEAKYKNVTINWIRKTENNEWMQNADKRANKLMKSWNG